MTEPQKDETKFNETLKRMLETPPKPHGPSDPAPIKPPRRSPEGGRAQPRAPDGSMDSEGAPRDY